MPLRSEESDSEEILRRATVIDTLHHRHGRQAMFDAAKELGIPEETLIEAEERWRTEKREREDFREFVRQQRSGWAGPRRLSAKPRRRLAHLVLLADLWA